MIPQLRGADRCGSHRVAHLSRADGRQCTALRAPRRFAIELDHPVSGRSIMHAPDAGPQVLGSGREKAVRYAGEVVAFAGEHLTRVAGREDDEFRIDGALEEVDEEESVATS